MTQTTGPQRQFVSFVGYRVEPEVRRLSAAEKQRMKEEFLGVFAKGVAGMMCLTYSTVGLKADTDFLLWRISFSAEHFQEHSAVINKTALGGYLRQAWSLLSMTKRSIYIDKIDPEHGEARLRLVPGRSKYLFVYPFVKGREWYLLPLEKRQQVMDTHIRIGNEFPSVKLNTTYSFGLDDQDFVVAFETDEPRDFLDLVMKLRETESSKYTVRDTPVFMGVAMPMERVLGQVF